MRKSYCLYITVRADYFRHSIAWAVTQKAFEP